MPATAQVNLDGWSTKAELLQIRQAVNFYVDHRQNGFYRSKDIDWDKTDVTRDDLDGKAGREAQVHIWGEGLCGASACDNAIVVWRNGRAEVIDMIKDSILSIMNVKSHGMYGLVGHYNSYRWDGKDYQAYCLPVNVCYREEQSSLEREDRDRDKVR